jgi:hypothetical protein
MAELGGVASSRAVLRFSLFSRSSGLVLSMIEPLPDPDLLGP